MNFYDELEEQVKIAALRSHRKHQQRKKVAQHGLAAVALIALLSFASLTMFSPDTAVAETVEVEQVGDVLTVRLLELDSSPSKVKSDLEEEGFTVKVEEFRTGPSKADTIVRLGSDSQLGSDGPYEILVPSSDPTLILGVGVLSDNTYEVPVNAFHEGEPLHCVPFESLTVEALRNYAEKHELDVTFQNVSDPTQKPADGDYLVSVDATSATHLVAFTSNDKVETDVVNC